MPRPTEPGLYWVIESETDRWSVQYWSGVDWRDNKGDRLDLECEAICVAVAPAIRRNVTPDEPRLSEPMQLERAELGGLLLLAGATLWCRENSFAITASPVPWDTSKRFPWVVEIHMAIPSRGNPLETFYLSISWPCSVDPRIPSREADEAIHAVCQRAVSHEAAEGLLINGKRFLDPHERGEDWTWGRGPRSFAAPVALDVAPAKAS
jgi:hypothetical protein